MISCIKILIEILDSPFFLNNNFILNTIKLEWWMILFQLLIAIPRLLWVFYGLVNLLIVNILTLNHQIRIRLMPSIYLKILFFFWWICFICTKHNFQTVLVFLYLFFMLTFRKILKQNFVLITALKCIMLVDSLGQWSLICLHIMFNHYLLFLVFRDAGTILLNIECRCFYSVHV